MYAFNHPFYKKNLWKIEKLFKKLVTFFFYKKFSKIVYQYMFYISDTLLFLPKSTHPSILPQLAFQSTEKKNISFTATTMKHFPFSNYQFMLNG